MCQVCRRKGHRKALVNGTKEAISRRWCSIIRTSCDARSRKGQQMRGCSRNSSSRTPRSGTTDIQGNKDEAPVYCVGPDSRRSLEYGKGYSGEYHLRFPVLARPERVVGGLYRLWGNSLIFVFWHEAATARYGQ